MKKGVLILLLIFILSLNVVLATTYNIKAFEYDEWGNQLNLQTFTVTSSDGPSDIFNGGNSIAISISSGGFVDVSAPGFKTRHIIQNKLLSPSLNYVALIRENVDYTTDYNSGTKICDRQEVYYGPCSIGEFCTRKKFSSSSFEEALANIGNYYCAPSKAITTSESGEYEISPFEYGSQGEKISLNHFTITIGDSPISVNFPISTLINIPIGINEISIYKEGFVPKEGILVNNLKKGEKNYVALARQGVTYNFFKTCNTANSNRDCGDFGSDNSNLECLGGYCYGKNNYDETYKCEGEGNNYYGNGCLKSFLCLPNPNFAIDPSTPYLCGVGLNPNVDPSYDLNEACSKNLDCTSNLCWDGLCKNINSGTLLCPHYGETEYIPVCSGGKNLCGKYFDSIYYVDDSCPEGTYCENNAPTSYGYPLPGCVKKKGIGENCELPIECISNNCLDGKCKLAGSTGTRPVVDDTGGTDETSTGAEIGEECEIDTDCASGQCGAATFTLTRFGEIFTGSKCRGCSVAKDCNFGETCLYGSCSTIGVANAIGEECSEDSDCATRSCFNNQCQAKSPKYGACDSNLDCQDESETDLRCDLDFDDDGPTDGKCISTDPCEDITCPTGQGCNSETGLCQTCSVDPNYANVVIKEYNEDNVQTMKEYDLYKCNIQRETLDMASCENNLLKYQQTAIACDANTKLCSEVLDTNSLLSRVGFAGTPNIKNKVNDCIDAGGGKGMLRSIYWCDRNNLEDATPTCDKNICIVNSDGSISATRALSTPGADLAAGAGSLRTEVINTKPYGNCGDGIGDTTKRNIYSCGKSGDSFYLSTLQTTQTACTNKKCEISRDGTVNYIKDASVAQGSAKWRCVDTDTRTADSCNNQDFIQITEECGTGKVCTDGECVSTTPTPTPTPQPSSDDRDNDWLYNVDEIPTPTGYGTNPDVADTDIDDATDGEEVLYGTNPNDLNSGGSCTADSDCPHTNVNGVPDEKCDTSVSKCRKNCESLSCESGYTCQGLYCKKNCVAGACSLRTLTCDSTGVCTIPATAGGGDDDDDDEGESCSDLDGVICSSGSTCVDGYGIWNYNTRDFPCCEPLNDNVVAKCSTSSFIPQTGQAVQVERTACQDPDGDGVGQVEVTITIEDENGRKVPLDPSVVQANYGIAENPYTEECTKLPNNFKGQDVPYFTIVSLILSLGLISVFYLGRNKFKKFF